METVAQKAQRLTDLLRVRIVKTDRYHTVAQVEGDHGKHTCVLYPDGASACNCYWGVYNHNPARLCSHLRALQATLADPALLAVQPIDTN